jgi:type VI secretion system protein ImpE
MDGDSRLGPVLEAIVNGRYYWVPFHRIRTIRLEEPEDLRDLVWMPAYFTWANEGEAVGLIPTRYPGSESSPDPDIRRARRTEWIEQGAETYSGLGQRMFFTDAGEYSLMDVRRIELESQDSSVEGRAAEAPAHAGGPVG